MRRRTNLVGESDIVRSWPNRISFKTYSKDEIIKLSVKEITECELVYEDRDAGAKTAQLNGLHDPALGPLNRGDRCTTCGATEKFCQGCPNMPEKSEQLGFARAYSGTRMPELPENSELKFTACPTETRADSGFSEPDPNFPKPENPNAQPWFCPGHCGHINLPSPVINPAFFATLKMLLCASCPDCSHFLCTEKALITLQAKLVCLNSGRMDIFNEIDRETKDHYGAEKDTEGATADENLSHGTKSKTLDELQEFLKVKTAPIDLGSPKDMNRSTVFHKRDIVNIFMEYFRKKIKKCPRCLTAIPSIKFESAGGVTRVYLELPRRKTEVDLEADSDGNSDDDEDEIDKEKRRAKSAPSADVTLQRVPTNMLFKQVKKLFKTERETCDLLFEGTGYEAFFIETVLVPPNRFRRMNKSGQKVLASDRTAMLQKILESSKKLSWLYGHRVREMSMDKMETDEGYESQGDRIKVKSFLTTLPGASLDEKQENLEMALQQLVNIHIDSNMEKSITTKNPGIKQKLEKKKGLFRQNIMGKRVNFCARTVITPDPNIATNEFGVSDFVAKKLTYPERVTQYNYKELRQAVINGPRNHPGATHILWPNGLRETLDPDDENQRVACANQLLTSEEDNEGLGRMKTVLRHLKSGDAILANRQPTLHKGSIMAFNARVVPGEKTFRLHYSNCKHFNADFDGDEMNVHFPQSEEARAEAELLMNTNHMFRSAKDGFPLAGLMQDHVIAGAMMCVRGAFFDKSEYQNLVINCLERHHPGKKIKFLPPAIFKPKTLWTGKQIITTILQNFCGGKGPNYVGNCKMKDSVFMKDGEKEQSIPNPSKLKGCSMKDSEFVVKNGYVCSGYLDKDQIGSAKYSILAAIEEIFGGPTVGKFITAVTYCLSHYLKCYRGFTLGIRDVVTSKKIAKKRKKIVKTGDYAGLRELAKHFELADDLPESQEELAELDAAVRAKIRHAHLVGTEFTMHEVDAICKKAANSVTEAIHRLCEPNLEEKFPRNNLETLIVTGAKGSKANLLNMASNLGQVEFDGKRPKIMASGRCFPCWKPYEHDVRSGAFISHRYAGGLRPQEMFFHVMAGRDGLIDTACKTSSSGYLQRCLIKHLEGITVSYDRTVRDHDQSVVQFQFGEDGIDVAKTPYMKPHQFDFIKENSALYSRKLWPTGKMPRMSEEVKRLQKQTEKFRNREAKNKWAERNVAGIERVLAFNDFLKSHDKLSEFNDALPSLIQEQGRDIVNSFNHMAIKVWHQVTTKKKKSGRVKKNLDPPAEELEEVFPGEQALTEDIRQMWIKKRIVPDPNIATLSPDLHLGSASEAFIGHVKEYLATMKQTDKPIQELLYSKYRQSLMPPGDQIGLVIAQSIGEPSTQMTLNTFHMAGKADVNITLGIPRLRELLMTAPTEVKTPSMTIPFHRHIKEAQVEKFVNSLKNIRLSDVITAVKGQNKLIVQEGSFVLQSEIEIKIGRKLCKELDLNPETVVAEIMRKKLFKVVIKKLEDAEKARSKQELFVSKNKEAAKPKRGARKADDGDDPDACAIPDENDKEEDIDECEYEDVDDEVKDEEDDAEEVGGNSDDESPLKQSETDQILKELNMTKSSGNFWEKVLSSHRSVTSVVHDAKKFSWILVTFNRDPSSENIDLVHIIESAVREISIQGIPKISKVTFKPSEDRTHFEILTEGINFPGFYKYPEMLDLNRISTNDVNAFRNAYGIEAAVMTMQREIDKVFKPYGIAVDKRHTSLVADYVTQEGQYRAFNRHGLKTCASPIQKMSYETTTQFLIDSIVYGEDDDMSSPAASVAAGQLFKGGTGYFDIRQQILF